MAENNIPNEALQNFYYGVCINSEDPLMLGRIRVYDTTDNITARINSSDGFDPNSNSTANGIWSKKDPFVCLPLLPYFVNQVPNKDERVIIFYFNNERKGLKDKYYVIAPYSSPTTIEDESYKSSSTHTAAGTQYSLEDLPNIKDPDGKIPEKSKGVFAEPIDISFQGRDTTDMILKKNEVLLRAGKHKKARRGEIPESEPKRAFLQLTKYDTKVNLSDPKVKFRLESQDQQLKFLIEYDILNPENTQDAFTGNITIYNLSNLTNELTKVSFFDVDTDLSGITLSKMYFEQFQAITMEEVINTINTVINVFKTNPNNFSSIPGVFAENSNYPFYYRPSRNVLSKLTEFDDDPNVVQAANMGILINNVGIIPGDASPGFGLVMDKKFTPYVPFVPVKEVFVNETTEAIDTTAGILGASDIYLLSHDSTIPGKEKINLDYDTLYGIDSDKLYTNIFTNTSSMVRGEELLELLDVIVNFLITHVHPYPLLPPSAVSTDGTSTDDILKKMLEAYEKVLNKKIRIN